MNPLQIQFINHSSVVIIKGDLRIICDPWIEGTVFQDGWEHLAKTAFKYDDFELITHIWFSHEHPDHFFPPNLKKIPLEFRNRITVLYHKTKDKKVINFCQKLGFKSIIEIDPQSVLELGDSLKIKCQNIGHDSYLYVTDDKHSILNVNDCVLRSEIEIKKIKNNVGNVDLLLTQFSYAQWEGNPNQQHLRIEAANKKFREIEMQISVLKPQFVMPFASFIYFCHEENYYANDAINKISETHDFIKEECNVVPIIMFINNKWTIGEPYQNEKAIISWNRQYELLKNKDLSISKSKSIDENQLLQSVNNFVKKIKRYFYFLDLYRINPLIIYISDLDKVIRLNPLKGAKYINKKESETHISLSSDSLNYCMIFNWGFNTLRVNARLKVNGRINGMKNFKIYEGLTKMMNHNEKYDSFSKRIINKLIRIK